MELIRKLTLVKNVLANFLLLIVAHLGNWCIDRMIDLESLLRKGGDWLGRCERMLFDRLYESNEQFRKIISDESEEFDAWLQQLADHMNDVMARIAEGNSEMLDFMQHLQEEQEKRQRSKLEEGDAQNE